MQLKVTDDNANKRIDSLIFEYLSSADDLALSRSHIRRLIDEGAVSINGNSVKPSFKPKPGDMIDIEIPEVKEVDIEPRDIPLDIIYEDQDILIVNKPKGMVVHPAPGHYEDTLVNAIMFHCKGSLSGINGELRPGIVHRIDRDTTGSLIICKNDPAHNNIAAQLSVHSIKREYEAIVYGSFKEPKGIIDAPIGRDPKDRKKMSLRAPNGKRAVTHYEVLEDFGDISFIKCRLETGRTHQIRVHMTSVNHPLLGDEVYKTGYKLKRKLPFDLQGQCLHAAIIGFNHPSTGEYMEFSAERPDYFVDLLEYLRKH